MDCLVDCSTGLTFPLFRSGLHSARVPQYRWVSFSHCQIVMNWLLYLYKIFYIYSCDLIFSHSENFLHFFTNICVWTNSWCFKLSFKYSLVMCQLVDIWSIWCCLFYLSFLYLSSIFLSIIYISINLFIHLSINQPIYLSI